MRLALYRGKWAVVGRDERGRVYRRSLGTPDRAAAERKFRDYRRETPGDTIADAATLYLEEKQKAGARSYQSMLTAFRALTPFFGHLRPDHITRDLCREYATQRRAAGVSDGTIIKDLGVLRAALRWAKKDAGAVFELPHAPPPKERYITRQEFERLLASAGQKHLALFILLAWSTGARAGALLDLTWDRVDFAREQIRLARSEGRRKGRATVPMTDRAKTALEAAHEARTCPYVIEWGGHQVRSVKRAFAEACRKAKLKEVTPHVLRHSAAVAMAEDGKSMAEIAQVLGHTDPAVTFRVYGRYSLGHMKKIIKALE